MVRTLLRKLSPISPGRGPFVRYKGQTEANDAAHGWKKRNFVLLVSLLLDLLPFFFFSFVLPFFPADFCLATSCIQGRDMKT